MIIAPAPNGYSRAYETERNRRITQADAENHKKRQDVEIGAARLILTSPNGSRWSVTVDNAGVLSASAI